MVLNMIGLGLGGVKDITVAGLEAVRRSGKVYLEAYTSILLDADSSDASAMDGREAASRLAAFYGVPVSLADREFVEGGEDILREAQEGEVSFLVVGDPFCATTHHDLMLRARHRGIVVNKYQNASIMNAVGSCGLQLYRFGQCVTMVFFTATWRPDSWYDRIKTNRAAGLHTLVLLDIKVKEQSIENMARGRKIYEPPRFMTCQQCAEQLLDIEGVRGEGVYGPDTLCVGVARLGSASERMVAASLADMASGKIDFGPPLHSLIIAGELSEFEAEMVNEIRFKNPADQG